MTDAPTFGVALTCIDGRLPDHVTPALRAEWGVHYVDLVTLPGVEGVLPALAEDDRVWEALRISVRRHGATQAAVVGHTDCAANDIDLPTRRDQVREAVFVLRDALPRVEVSGWVLHTATGFLEEV